MVAVRRLDQLRRDADLVAGLAHAALQDVRDVELLRHVLDVDLLALELEGRGARGNPQIGDLCQQVEQLLRQAIREVFGPCSPLMSTNGSTAMDLAAAWTGASAGDAPDAASVAAGMGAVRGMNRSTATTTIATTSSPTTMRSSLRAVSAVIEALRSISCSRFRPSGVSS